MGLLVVFCNDTSQIYMKMGDKMETYVKSETQSYFISEYFNPLARKGDLVQGFFELHRALREEISARIEFEKSYSQRATIITTSFHDLDLSSPSSFSGRIVHTSFAIFLIFLVIIMVIMLDVQKSNRKKVTKKRHAEA